MDGDQRMKQHERLMARSGNSAAGGRATDHFESTGMHPRGEPTGMSQAPERAQMSYDQYGYTGGSYHSGSLQPHELPGYPPEFTRSRQGQVTQQHPHPHSHTQQHPNPQSHQHQHQHQTPHEQHPSQPGQQSQQQSRRRTPHDPALPFVPYESAMLYGFGQQGPAQGPFDVVPQYSPRQSAAIEALSNQFAVPQYFTPEESTATGVPNPALSPYLGQQQIPYNHPGPMARPSTTQPFPATMSDFTPIGTAGSSRLDPQPPQIQHHSDPPQLPASDLSSLEEAYSQYQRALRSTFDHTRTGRLVEASRSLLEISEWLVTNSRDLGILRDDNLSYPDRLELWKEFNICWLAVCQKQKDLTQGYTGDHPSVQITLLTRDRMEAMGKALIQLCDQLEQHGLVDYQMGIWEEEILCVLGQCLDLLESKPELRMQAVPEPPTAVPRP
ncbi:hypothetical protein N7466_009266 [Penicillium verhagenii]|uniref:uncharacterized protein n=1 Tax=Penicillium verhagenii TaxID=1562060 RepID=UPI0025451E16|nr:uncharacterized protein N7466_009266 [Penicillium verhagenii]KAJ5920940.1 hypothetical protein N7466_009266 [Penicillium verhagenii]